MLISESNQSPFPPVPRAKRRDAQCAGNGDAALTDSAPPPFTVREAGGQTGDYTVLKSWFPARDIWKRFIDVTLALLLTLILLPFLTMVSLLIVTASPGPIIFRQVRVGQNGRPFVLYKFRTMAEGAEGLLEQDQSLKEEFSKRWKLDNDPRVTPLGRWLRKSSIDELPQLINVLRGEMSLVGPRPVQPAEIEEWYGEFADVVFSVKPGLTGLWQVAGRSASSYEERIALDLEYIHRRSVWFDLLLLARTIPAVLFMRGAS